MLNGAREAVLSRFSLSQLTLADSTFSEDLQLCADLGVKGLGVAEYKIPVGEESSLRTNMAGLGVAATLGSPRTTSVLPSLHGRGSDDPEERVQEICSGIRRLAGVGASTVFAVTGPVRSYSVADAWRLSVSGLTEAVACAREAGVTLSFEPMRPEFADDYCFIHDFADYLRLVDAVGEDLKIVYDVYHLWDSKDVLALTRRYAKQVTGVQVADYRPPIRGFMDRALPGEGIIPLRSIFDALEEGGFEGWYDLEVFSDPALPDSIWKRPTRDWVTAGQQGFLKAWAGDQ